MQQIQRNGSMVISYNPDNGATIVFSYGVPVVVQTDLGSVYRTDAKYSMTTTKHTNKGVAYFGSDRFPASIQTVSQDRVNQLAYQ